MIAFLQSYAGTFVSVYSDRRNWLKLIGLSLIVPVFIFVSFIAVLIGKHGDDMFSTAIFEDGQRPIDLAVYFMFSFGTFAWSFCLIFTFIFMVIKRQSVWQQNLSLLLLLLGMFLIVSFSHLWPGFGS